MDRFARLFGRKPPQPSGGETEKETLQVTTPAPQEAPAGPEAEASPVPPAGDSGPAAPLTVAPAFAPAAEEAQPAPALKQSEEQVFGLQFGFRTGETRTFTKLPIWIGRAGENDLVLADGTVSARHARVFFDARLNQVCIEDKDSLNGVFINDQPTRKNILRDGDAIRLGQIELNFRDTGYIPADVE